MTPPSAVPAGPVPPAAPVVIQANQIQQPSPGILQRYAPILLIANLFVMVLLLIAVAIVFHHR
jgi:hypothetical protein